MTSPIQNARAAFKAYDIRGRYPEELDCQVARRIGLAYARLFSPGRVVVGHDIRLSSPVLAAALTQGLTAGGVEVLDLGLCGTEEVYFAVLEWGLDGGVMVTASHNPANYNGMKLVGPQARPISGENGLDALRDLVLDGPLPEPKAPPAQVLPTSIHDRFLDFALARVEVEALPPLKVLCDPGNGGAGILLERLEGRLPIEIILRDAEPDGSFPRGVPNPLLPEKRLGTSQAVVENRADLGVAWDGDFDRCFFYDESGRFIEGYYLVGLFAERFLRRFPGSRILHDPRLTWNTLEIVQQAGGIPVQSKTGHAFIKQNMRREDAVYGGEMSAHHYFREFGYCDSGILPWLFLMELMGTTGRPLSEMVEARMKRFPVSGEINRRVEEPATSLCERVLQRYQAQALTLDRTDGLSLEFLKWRFNLRSSNTEPLIRLNVETRADEALLKEKTAELLELIGGVPA